MARLGSAWPRLTLGSARLGLGSLGSAHAAHSARTGIAGGSRLGLLAARGWNWVSDRARLGFNPFSSDGDGGRRRRRTKGRRSKAETKRERGTPGMAACGVARPFAGGRRVPSRDSLVVCGHEDGGDETEEKKKKKKWWRRAWEKPKRRRDGLACVSGGGCRENK